MKKRKSLSRRASRKLYKKGVTRTEPKNISQRPMRGGIRL